MRAMVAMVSKEDPAVGTAVSVGGGRAPCKTVIPATVVVGPSGVGKGTLLKRLRDTFPNKFQVAVSHTTRNPREGEVNGQHYHFVTREHFQQMVTDGDFIEHAEFGGNFYGTSIQAVQDVAEKRKICLLEIDLVGAQSMKQITQDQGLNTKFLFITTTGGAKTCRDRLTSRGTEKPEAIERRCKRALEEIDFMEKNKTFFNLVVFNDDLEVAAKEVTSAFSDWYPALPKVNRGSVGTPTSGLDPASRTSAGDGVTE